MSISPVDPSTLPATGLEPYRYLDHADGYVSQPYTCSGSSRETDNYIEYATNVSAPAFAKTHVSFTIFITYMMADSTMQHTSVRVSGIMTSTGWHDSTTASYISHEPAANVRVYVGADSAQRYRTVVHTDTPVGCKLIASRLSNIVFHNSNSVNLDNMLLWHSSQADALPTDGVVNNTIYLETSSWGSASGSTTTAAAIMPNNLVHSSGRFLHGEGPYPINQTAGELDGAYDSDPVYTAANSDNIFGAPGFVFDTQTYGGAADNLDVLARESSIYDGINYPESTSFSISVVSTGTSDDKVDGYPNFLHDSAGGKVFLQNIGNVAVGVAYTAAMFVRAESKEFVVQCTHVDGVAVDNGNMADAEITGDAAWHHICISNSDSTGYANPFGIWASNQHGGLKVYIAKPYLGNGAFVVSPAAHKFPLPNAM